MGTMALTLRAKINLIVGGLTLLANVDYKAVGLEDFGRPDGFLERQIRRWTKQLKSSQSREVPGIDDLAGFRNDAFIVKW